MPHRTVPRPRQPPRTDEQVKPTLLFPLQEPSQSLECPALLCPPRDHHFISTNTVTTHLIPTAFPRVSPFVPLPPVPEHESKDERGARGERYASVFIAQQTQHAPDKSESQPATVLWTVLNRYVSADTSSRSGTGLALLLLHANGLHKEVRCERINILVFCWFAYYYHDDCRPSSRRYANYLRQDLRQLITTSDTKSMRSGPLMR